MNSHRLTLGLSVATLVVVVAGLGWQWRINEELRLAIGMLEAAGGGAAGSTSAAEASPDRTAGGEPATKRGRTDELAQMREDIEQLKTRTQAVARLAVRNAEGAVLLNLRPSSAWKNSGRGTPANAIETLLLAAEGGDVDTLAASILLDAEAREKAQAILDRLPEAVRATYGTPEKLIALLMARDSDIRAMQVLSENQANNDALVMMRVQKGDGKTKDEGYSFRRDGDGWRLVIPGKAVDKYGKKLSDPPKKGG